MAKKTAPVPITFQAAITGPGFYAAGTDMAQRDQQKNSGRRIAEYMPGSPEQAAQEGLFAVLNMGATTVHIHPVEAGTGFHRKTTTMYEIPTGYLRAYSGAVIANDASANSVPEMEPVKALLLQARLRARVRTQPDDETPLYDSTSPYYAQARDQYLQFRMAGLKNQYPPDMFTILASNETVFFQGQNDGVKEIPFEFVQTFLKESVLYMNAYPRPITGLAEISLDPGGIGSIRKALQFLREEGIREGDPDRYIPRGLSISLLVGARGSFPIDPSDRLYRRVGEDLQELAPETAEQRFNRILNQAIELKEEYGLPGPINFGTIVDNNAGPDVQPRVVWDWVARWAQDPQNAEMARKYGLVIKAGLEECATRITQDQSEGYAVSKAGKSEPVTDPYTGAPTRRVQVTNQELLETAMGYMASIPRTLPSGRKTDKPLFEIITDPAQARANLLETYALAGQGHASAVTRQRKTPPINTDNQPPQQGNDDDVRIRKLRKTDRPDGFQR